MTRSRLLSFNFLGESRPVLAYVILALLIVLPGSISARIIRVPDDQQTIQAGIDAANNGDTVLVAPGRYNARITIRDRNITLASRYLLSGDFADIARTVIDGNDQGRVVSFVNGNDRSTLFTGFTVTGGLTNYGGGIYLLGSGPTIRRVAVVGNEASNRGG
ncbi:MAG: hypothetical protein FJY67_10585, partial [Calditrichaeota bacterium]|nr:hypothetical protein [Calditrichota bacterium]